MLAQDDQLLDQTNHLSQEARDYLLQSAELNQDEVLNRISVLLAACDGLRKSVESLRNHNNRLNKMIVQLQMERDFHRNQADQLRVAYDNLRKNPLKVFFSQFHLFGGK